MARERVAVVGGGAGGLGAAFLLARGGRAVTLYEAGASAGGHARTVDVALPRGAPRPSVALDTGFIVYNAATYPDLVSLFETLRVPQDNSSMSFAASVDLGDGGRIEWGSDGLDCLFADRRNLLRPGLYSMLYDMRRFNYAVHAYVARVATDPGAAEAGMTLAEFLSAGAYSNAFISAYLLPMVSAVWSAPFRGALAFPARALFRFFVAHGLAQTFARPQWRTPLRRSRDYVAAVLEDLAAHGAAVRLSTRVAAVRRGRGEVAVVTEGGGEEVFDQVVFACHAPAVLELLGAGASPVERRVLGAFRYAENVSVVHMDARLMPVCRGTWSGWNFVSRRGAEAEAMAAGVGGGGGGGGSEDKPVCVTYWLNKLQNLNRGAAGMPDLFETLNPCVAIDPSKVLSEARFQHPQFTEESVRAQDDLQNVIQGENRSWFCGAYARYGFHEDALMTGLDVAERLTGYKVLRPWRSKERLAINNNYRRYDVPFASSPRSLGVVYLGGLFVVNLVGMRIHAGLSTLSKRLTPDNPSVVLSAGAGTVLRFGHATAASSKPGLVNIRSPQLLARVTDAIRHHRDLVPVAVASFVAGEIDCPLPSDLTTMLHALIVAQKKGPEVGHGLQGQMHLAETLLHAIVGGFEDVAPPASACRLPELSAAVHAVLAPWWWLGGGGGGEGAGGGRPTAVGPSMHGGQGGVYRMLEIGSDLSAEAVRKLQAHPSWRATVVVPAASRVQCAESKAKLLNVGEQVSVLSMEAFTAEKAAGRLGVFHHVASPAMLNLCSSGGPFATLLEFLATVWQLLCHDSDAVAVLGFTSCDDVHAQKKECHRRAADAMYCGDPGYRLQPSHAVLDAAKVCGFRLVSFEQMPGEAAAGGVEAAVQRMFVTLAADQLTTTEIRRALGQFCLWQAALLAGVASRSRVILRRPSSVVIS